MTFEKLLLYLGIFVLALNVLLWSALPGLVQAAREELFTKCEQRGYLAEDCKRVVYSGLWIGMPSGLVHYSLDWGEPTTKNRTTTGAGVHEQWVYRKDGAKTRYLYFENGLLVGVQD